MSATCMGTVGPEFHFTMKTIAAAIAKHIASTRPSFLPNEPRCEVASVSASSSSRRRLVIDGKS